MAYWKLAFLKLASEEESFHEVDSRVTENDGNYKSSLLFNLEIIYPEPDDIMFR